LERGNEFAGSPPSLTSVNCLYTNPLPIFSFSCLEGSPKVPLPPFSLSPPFFNYDQSLNPLGSQFPLFTESPHFTQDRPRNSFFVARQSSGCAGVPQNPFFFLFFKTFSFSQGPPLAFSLFHPPLLFFSSLSAPGLAPIPEASSMANLRTRLFIFSLPLHPWVLGARLATGFACCCAAISEDALFSRPRMSPPAVRDFVSGMLVERTTLFLFPLNPVFPPVERWRFPRVPVFRFFPGVLSFFPFL